MIAYLLPFFFICGCLHAHSYQITFPPFFVKLPKKEQHAIQTTLQQELLPKSLHPHVETFFHQKKKKFIAGCTITVMSHHAEISLQEITKSILKNIHTNTNCILLRKGKKQIFSLPSLPRFHANFFLVQSIPSFDLQYLYYVLVQGTHSYHVIFFAPIRGFQDQLPLFEQIIQTFVIE